MNDSDKTQILVALINSGQIQLPYQRLIRDVIERFSKKSLQTTDEKGRELTIEELSQKRRKFLLTAAKLDAEYLHLFWVGLVNLTKKLPATNGISLLKLISFFLFLRDIRNSFQYLY